MQVLNIQVTNLLVVVMKSNLWTTGVDKPFGSSPARERPGTSCGGTLAFKSSFLLSDLRVQGTRLDLYHSMIANAETEMVRNGKFHVSSALHGTMHRRTMAHVMPFPYWTYL